MQCVAIALTAMAMLMTLCDALFAQLGIGIMDFTATWRKYSNKDVSRFGNQSVATVTLTLFPTRGRVVLASAPP